MPVETFASHLTFAPLCNDWSGVTSSPQTDDQEKAWLEIARELRDETVSMRS